MSFGSSFIVARTHSREAGRHAERDDNDGRSADQGGVVPMIRSLCYSLVGVTLMAGAGLAQEPAAFGGSEYYADANTPFDGSRPAGFAADGHPQNPPARLAYASGYPNGVYNYGNPPHIRDYRGPGAGCRTCSNGECQYRFYGQPDLFYNYYAWPSCTGLGSELYLSPRPVPPHVGNTYITYQPLMPHEFLYTHHRTYHRYYNGGQGLNRTCVHYRASLLPWCD
jgi:hypothetical protein